MRPDQMPGLVEQFQQDEAVGFSGSVPAVDRSLENFNTAGIQGCIVSREQHTQGGRPVPERSDPFGIPSELQPEDRVAEQFRQGLLQILFQKGFLPFPIPAVKLIHQDKRYEGENNQGKGGQKQKKRLHPVHPGRPGNLLLFQRDEPEAPFCLCFPIAGSEGAVIHMSGFQNAVRFVHLLLCRLAGRLAQPVPHLFGRIFGDRIHTREQKADEQGEQQQQGRCQKTVPPQQKQSRQCEEGNVRIPGKGDTEIDLKACQAAGGQETQPGRTCENQQQDPEKGEAAQQADGREMICV